MINKNKQNTQNNSLNAEQLQTAVELRQNAGKAAVALAQTKDDKRKFSHVYMGPDGRLKSPSALTVLAYDVEQGIKQVSATKASRAASKHYKKHEGAYQTQALAEATAAGVTINGWNTAEDEQEAKPVIGTLQFDLVNNQGSRPVEIKLTGSLEEAQDAALQTVLAAEMSPTMEVIQNANIMLPNGSEASWQEFTAPAIERQMAAIREA